MTTNTPYYNLVLYNDTTDSANTFSVYRASVDGVSASNMIKIDTALAGLQSQIINNQGVAYISATATGTNVFAVSGISQIPSYTTGQVISLNLSTSITGSSTLNINTLGAKNLSKVNQAGSIVTLISGDMIAGNNYTFVYDGVEWLLADTIVYSVISETFHNFTGKTTPVDADELGLIDSASSNLFKKLTWSNLKATLKTYFDTLYATAITNYKTISILVSDPNGSAITTQEEVAYARVPSTMNGLSLLSVAAHVSTVSSSGLPTVAIRNVTTGFDMLTTSLTIDVSEKDSLTATTPAVIDASHKVVSTGDEIAIDIDVAGTGTKGLVVEMIFG